MGGAVHRRSRPGDGKGHLSECAWQDADGGQGEAESGHGSSEKYRSCESEEVHGGQVDGRVIRKLRQGQGPALLPPDLPGIH